MQQKKKDIFLMKLGHLCSARETLKSWRRLTETEVSPQRFWAVSPQGNMFGAMAVE